MKTEDLEVKKSYLHPYVYYSIESEQDDDELCKFNMMTKILFQKIRKKDKNIKFCTLFRNTQTEYMIESNKIYSYSRFYKKCEFSMRLELVNLDKIIKNLKFILYKPIMKKLL